MGKKGRSKRSKHALSAIAPSGKNREGTKCSWYILEEEVEALVIGYLEYQEALAVSISCRDFIQKEHHIHHILKLRLGKNQRLFPFFQQLTEGSRHLPMRSMKNVTAFELYNDSSSSSSTSSFSAIGAAADNDESASIDSSALSPSPPSLSVWTPAQQQQFPKLLRGFRFFFPSLSKLDLGGCTIGLKGATELAAGLKGMNGWPTLHHLNLRGNLICSTGFRRLAEAMDATVCPLLEHIDLENNSIGAEGLSEAQAKLPPGLKYLNFRDNELGDVGVAQLAILFEAGGCPVLETLYLGINGIGQEGITALAKALSSGHLQALSFLELSSNALSGPWVLDANHLLVNETNEQGIQALAGALQTGSCPNLATLGLDDIDMGNTGMKALSRALKAGYCRALTHLNLGDNYIAAEGLEAFGEVLKSRACLNLKELILDGCEALTDASCSRLFAVLGEGGGICSNLSRLSLRSVEITDEGAKSLATAIASGGLPSLESLSLEYTNIRDDALMAFIEAFTQYPTNTLRDLKFRCSCLTNAGARAFMFFLLDHPTIMSSLREVDLRATNIVGSEKLRRIKSRLFRARPELTFLYD